ncbi:MAG: tetratricopeptide repeat protein [Myxococcaceae bacterium]
MSSLELSLSLLHFVVFAEALVSLTSSLPMRVCVPMVALSLIAVGCEKRASALDEVEGIYLRAQNAFLLGKFDDALAEYGEVAKRQPDHPRLPAARGEALLALGRFRDAALDFERAIVLDPKRATNHARLGFARAQVDDPRAQAASEEAVRLNPDDALAHETLGELARRRKAWPLAAREFEAAARLLTGVERQRLAMAALRAWQGAGDVEALLRLAKAEQAGGHASVELLTAAGETLLGGNALALAAESYRAAAQLAKRDPTLLELAGEIEVRRGQTDLAQKDFEASLAVKDRTTVRVALLRLALQRGDKAIAEEQLKKALEVATGSDPRETQELADGLVRMGRKRDALLLLDNLSAEPGMRPNVKVQQRTAELAKQLGERDILRVACARLRDADAGVPQGCP